MGISDNLFGKEPAKNPEDDFTIMITDELVRVEHPQRKTEQISWNDIKEIWLVNTDTGPASIDIWLALVGDGSGCLVPHGTDGYNKVYDIVSAYDGFDFEKVIESMSSTADERFVVWKKK